MLAILFIISSLEHISEVGGTQLIDTASSGDSTYILFRQSMMQFEVYAFDWHQYQKTQEPTFIKFPKDSRIKIIAFANLVALKDGALLVSCGLDKAFLLSTDGTFKKQYLLRSIYEPEEKTYSAFGHGNKIYLVTKLNGTSFLSEYDPDEGKRKIIYNANTQGAYYFHRSNDSIFKIRYTTGELELMNEQMTPTYFLPALFKEPEEVTGLVTSLKKQDLQSLSTPIFGAQALTMNFTVRKKGEKLRAAARFNGRQWVFSRYRPLSLEPNGERMIIYDYKDDELRIVPSSFKYKETKIPPLPDDEL